MAVTSPLEQLMPRITDEDDVNLDDVNTDPPENDQDAGAEGDGEDGDPALPDGEDDQTNDDAGDPEDEESEEEGEDAGADALATRGRQPQEQTRRGGRENARVRALNDQLREERTQREALQRRFDEFATRQPATPAVPRETPDQRNARRALLTDAERHAEDMQELRDLVVNSTRTTQMTVQDQADKSVFDAKAVTDPLFKKWAPKVEAELTRIRQNGGNVPREAVLRYLLGGALLDGRGKVNKTQQALGRRRVERQTTRTNDTRNDATQSRRTGRQTLEDRLANQPL